MDAAGKPIEPGVYFRIALGGATGHKAFARDLGVLVPPAEINKVVVAVLRVYIERGCRTMNIDHVRLTTDTSLGVVLSSYLAHRLARSSR